MPFYFRLLDFLPRSRANSRTRYKPTARELAHRRKSPDSRPAIHACTLTRVAHSPSPSPLPSLLFPSPTATTNPPPLRSRLLSFSMHRLVPSFSSALLSLPARLLAADWVVEACHSGYRPADTPNPPSPPSVLSIDESVPLPPTQSRHDSFPSLSARALSFSLCPPISLAQTHSLSLSLSLSLSVALLSTIAKQSVCQTLLLIVHLIRSFLPRYSARILYKSR